MKFKKFIAFAAALSVMLTGCSSTSENSEDISTISQENVENTSAKEDITEASKQPETEEEFHQAMIDRSLLSTGNNSRLKATLEQLRSGEKTTIAYIGGSITYGVGATSPEKCWAKLSYNYISDTFGTGENTEYTNAGISGTPSVLGNLRAGRDIPEADIVFIEFAVNDAQDDIHKQSYESLVRTVLERENAPAVILVINRIESGYTCQEHMSQIGEHYQLPMLSVNDALTPEFDEGRMVWRDYSNDGSHPNDHGHELIREMVENMFTVIDSEEADEEYSLPLADLFGTGYRNARLVTPENIDEFSDFSLVSEGQFVPLNMGADSFPYSFARASSADNNGNMKVTLDCNSFFVIYKRNKTPEMGKIVVYCDGNKLATINACDPDGWGDPYASRIIKFNTTQERTFEIEVPEDSLDKEFYILGFGYSSNNS